MAKGDNSQQDPLEALTSMLGQLMAGGWGGGSQDDPPVYWGPTGHATGHKPPGATMKVDGEFYVGKGDGTKRLSEAQLDFYNWSTAQRNEWGDYLAKIGYIDPEDKGDYTTLLQAWNDACSQAAGFTRAGKKLTPRQVIELMAGAGKTTGKRSASQRPFTGTKTYTSQSVDLTDPATAKALVNDVLSSALGREANPEELAAFRNSLAAAEHANPRTTTTATTYQDSEAVAESSTTSGGLDVAGKQQLLRDQAMQKPEYGAYQSARMVMDWLAEAISSPV